MIDSLWRQAGWLSRHIEWDLRGNHLIRDAVGLAWAGQLFEGPEPAVWRRQALRIARGQVREQILADGAHFELSPSYHLEVRQDLRELDSLLDKEDTTDVTAAVDVMGEYADWTRHPNGALLHRNDGSSISTEPMGAMPNGGRWFRDAGLVAWHDSTWSLFFDAGQIGPREQPGHAHADSLTIECSFRGAPLVVDPGCLRYDLDKTRRYDRSTAAHNTVEIDGQDSSEVWHIFRVGRRARIVDAEYSGEVNGFSASAEHDGYRFLPGSPRHRRSLSLAKGVVTIVDQVSGGEQHSLAGGLLIHPDWQVRLHETEWVLDRGGDAILIRCASTASIRLSVEPQPWRPSYGLERGTQRLVWRCSGRLPIEVRIALVPVNPGV